MAATSHDFWLANLSAPVWKTLHMLVYLAYALLVLHVTFGALQSEVSPVLTGAMAIGLAKRARAAFGGGACGTGLWTAN
jgi:sulfoxide reductase heme-binding subunit YedZ